MDEGGSVDSLEDENSKADTSVMLPAQFVKLEVYCKLDCNCLKVRNYKIDNTKVCKLWTDLYLRRGLI